MSAWARSRLFGRGGRRRRLRLGRPAACRRGGGPAGWWWTLTWAWAGSHSERPRTREGGLEKRPPWSRSLRRRRGERRRLGRARGTPPAPAGLVPQWSGMRRRLGPTSPPSWRGSCLVAFGTVAAARPPRSDRPPLRHARPHRPRGDGGDPAGARPEPGAAGRSARHGGSAMASTPGGRTMPPRPALRRDPSAAGAGRRLRGARGAQLDVDPLLVRIGFVAAAGRRPRRRALRARLDG